MYDLLVGKAYIYSICLGKTIVNMTGAPKEFVSGPITRNTETFT